MSELRDVEAIRPDLAVLAEQPRTQQGARAMGDLAADVEPLLAALAEADARAGDAEALMRSAHKSHNEVLRSHHVAELDWIKTNQRVEQQLRQVREQVGKMCDELMEFPRGTVEHVIGARLDYELTALRLCGRRYLPAPKPEKDGNE